MKVTFIGLGNIGSGIASCILKAGFDLVVYNRTREKMESFLRQRCQRRKGFEDAVKDADVVITMLMDDKSVWITSKTPWAA